MSATKTASRSNEHLTAIEPLTGSLPTQLEDTVSMLRDVPDFQSVPTSPQRGTRYSQIYRDEFSDLINALRPFTRITQNNSRLYLRKRVTDPAGSGVPSAAWVGHRRSARGPSGQVVPEQADEKMTTFSINDIYILTHCLGIVTSQPEGVDPSLPVSLPVCRGALKLRPETAAQNDYLAWVHEQASRRLYEAPSLARGARDSAMMTPLKAAHAALSQVVAHSDEATGLPPLLGRSKLVQDAMADLYGLIDLGFTGDPARDERLPSSRWAQAERSGFLHHLTAKAYLPEE